jgi:tetratricopeptide (TPR) repeat protein
MVKKKSVLSKVDRAMLTKARRDMSAGQTGLEATGIAFKGNEEEAILRTIKDTALIRLFKRFSAHLADKELLSPKDNCAMSVYEHMPSDTAAIQLKAHMKLLLVTKLQEGFSELLRYFYNDALDKFDFAEKYKIEQRVNACLALIGPKHYLYKKMKAQQLFLSACDLAMGFSQGMPITSRMTEKMQDGIALLKQATTFDPMAPYLYLRLGDYYLNTFAYDESIMAYETYHQLLPNDEYAYNKLGLAYLNKKKYNKAMECFANALRINNRLYKAQENYKAARAICPQGCTL